MDEIEYKLKSKNVILITEAIDLLLDRIIELSINNVKNEDASIPLSFLRRICTSDDPAISLTASKGFLSLILGGVLEISSAMSIAMSMLPSTKNYAAISSIVSGIMVMTIEQKVSTEKNYTPHWALDSPQHPFVMMLQQHPSAIGDVMSQMQAICYKQVRILSFCHELMRPVFFWIFCNPNNPNESLLPKWHHSALQLLISLENSPRQESLILECLGWQQMTPYSQCHHSYEIYAGVTEWAISNNKHVFVSALIPALGNFCYEIVSAGEDPRPCLLLIHKALAVSGAHISSDVLLALLSEALLICPVPYILDLIALCEKSYKLCEGSLSTFILASALLQWIYYPTSLTYDYMKHANELIESIFKTTLKPPMNTMILCSNKIFHFIKSTNWRIYRITELLITSGKFLSTDNIYTMWMSKLNQCNNIDMKCQLIPFLQGLLLQKSEFEGHGNRIKVFEMLMDNVKCKRHFATGMLPLTLFSLKNSTDPNETLQYLRGVPYLTVSKENVPLIIRILEDLECQVFPRAVLIDLYVILVDNQNRCYPYLQAVLVKSSTGADWEVLTAVAAAIKHICETRAANYGAELVPMLSGLLNKCTDANSSLGFCLCLEALRALWRACIVSPASTWRVLAPKISRDKRPSVQVSICKLLAEVPALKYDSPEYESFMQDAVGRLWSISANSQHPEVVTAAFEALAMYKVTDMTLQQIPEIYRKNIQLPKTYCQTPSDAARKPEDVMDYIPSECWGNLFKYANDITLAGVSTLCHTLMTREIEGYRSGVYTMPTRGSRGEPSSAEHLPTASVVRGLLEFVRKQALQPSYNISDMVFQEALVCLGRPLPRPLPPMAWTFLHDLHHKGAHLRAPGLLLAARQAVLSGTALQFIESYLSSFKPSVEKESEICVIAEILPILCTNIPPNSIGTALVAIMDYTFALSPEEKSEENEDLFIKTLQAIQQCLQNKKTLDENRTMLAEHIENYYTKIDENHIFWPAFVDVCCDMPVDYLERLTAPSSWWEVTGEMIRKACCVRAGLSCRTDLDNPLLWLNEIIDASIKYPSEHVFVLRKMCYALMKAKYESSSTRTWLLQLMARTQIHMTESAATESSITFLCDIIIMSVILFSQLYTLNWSEEPYIISRATRTSIFPQAMVTLFIHTKSSEWKDEANQVLEWLHHSRHNKHLSQLYTESFHLALVAGRHSVYFQKQNVWMKFLSSKLFFDIK